MRHPSSRKFLGPVLASATLALAGCSLLHHKQTDAEPVAADPKAAGTPAPVASSDDDPVVAPVRNKGLADEQELKVAKLWTRVDELEEEIFRQKERIRVLEKGLTLGLVPEELMKPEPPSEPKGKKPARADKAAPEAKAEPGKDATSAAGLAKDDEAKYQTGLANAHGFYRDGKYGRAIVAYSELTKQFGEGVDNGLPLYWIAKCWSALGEYESARQELIEFLSHHGTSPWVPRAKLELARVQWHSGEQESALATLRGIIEQYPYEDATEMAKMELQSLTKQLDLLSPTDLPPTRHAVAKRRVKPRKSQNEENL